MKPIDWKEICTEISDRFRNIDQRLEKLEAKDKCQHPEYNRVGYDIMCTKCGYVEKDFYIKEKEVSLLEEIRLYGVNPAAIHGIVEIFKRRFNEAADGGKGYCSTDLHGKVIIFADAMRDALFGKDNNG